jgi:hypothetical protein
MTSTEAARTACRRPSLSDDQGRQHSIDLGRVTSHQLDDAAALGELTRPWSPACWDPV